MTRDRRREDRGEEGRRRGEAGRRESQVLDGRSEEDMFVCVCVCVCVRVREQVRRGERGSCSSLCLSDSLPPLAPQALHTALVI